MMTTALKDLTPKASKGCLPLGRKITSFVSRPVKMLGLGEGRRGGELCQKLA